MARSFGKVFASIWGDPEFVGLPSGPQRLYMLLISQSGLTLAGSLDLMPERWATRAPDTDVDDILNALVDLAGARFVAVDWDTREVVIRTLPRHDLDNNRLNINLIKGLWTSWAGILSPVLRKVVVDNLPDAVWDKSGASCPTEAQQMRTSARLQLPVRTGALPPVQTGGSDQPSEPPVPTDGSDHPSEPPSFLVPRVSPSPPPPGGPNRTSPEISPTDPAVTAEQRQQRIHQACQLLTDRHLAHVPSQHNRQRHHDATLNGKIRDHSGLGHQALVDDPSLSVEQLADLLEPPVDPAPNARPTPLDGAAAAQRQRTETGTQSMQELASVPIDPDGPAHVADARTALHQRTDPPNGATP